MLDESRGSSSDVKSRAAVMPMPIVRNSPGRFRRSMRASPDRPATMRTRFPTASTVTPMFATRSARRAAHAGGRAPANSARGDLRMSRRCTRRAVLSPRIRDRRPGGAGASRSRWPRSRATQTTVQPGRSAQRGGGVQRPRQISPLNPATPLAWAPRHAGSSPQMTVVISERIIANASTRPSSGRSSSDGKGGLHRRLDAFKDSGRPHGQQETARARTERQHQALSQQLTHRAGSRGAERVSCGQLAARSSRRACYGRFCSRSSPPIRQHWRAPRCCLSE